MKKYLILFISIFTACIGYSQSGDKTVTLTVSGQGATLDKARQSALRTAIEQAFGTFISSKTEILNDEMVADQITSVSAGNIQSFETLNEAELPNGTWAVTMKAVVSVEKLTSFVQSKGVEVTVKGGLFTLNIKQQLLNEQGETDAICEMVGVLHEPMQTAFDYVLQNGEPKSLDAESQNWEIPISVSVVANKNLEVCMDYFRKTIASIALSKADKETYKKLGKNVFPIIFTYNTKDTFNSYQAGEYKKILIDKEAKDTFYLRRARSMEALLSFLNNWKFYTSNFSITDGIDIYDVYNTAMERTLGVRKFGGSNKEYYVKSQWTNFFTFTRDGSEDNYERFKATNRDGFSGVTGYGMREEKDFRIKYFVHCFNTNDTIAGFFFNDKKTIVEMEKLEKYKISANGVVSEFKHGGYVVFQDSGHGLVASLMDCSNYLNLPAEEFVWGRRDEKLIIDSLVQFNNKFLDSVIGKKSVNGYSDWRIPTSFEFEKIITNLVYSEISVFRIGTGVNIGSPYITDTGSLCIMFYRPQGFNKRNYFHVKGNLNKSINFLKKENYHLFGTMDDGQFITTNSPLWYGIKRRIRDHGYIRPVRTF